MLDCQKTINNDKIELNAKYQPIGYKLRFPFYVIGGSSINVKFLSQRKHNNDYDYRYGGYVTYENSTIFGKDLCILLIFVFNYFLFVYDFLA